MCQALSYKVGKWIQHSPIYYHNKLFCRNSSSCSHKSKNLKHLFPSNTTLCISVFKTSKALCISAYFTSLIKWNNKEIVKENNKTRTIKLTTKNACAHCKTFVKRSKIWQKERKSSVTQTSVLINMSFWQLHGPNRIIYCLIWIIVFRTIIAFLEEKGASNRIRTCLILACDVA